MRWKGWTATLVLTAALVGLLAALPSFATPPEEAEQACMELGLTLGPTFEAEEIFVGSTKEGVTITDVVLDEDGEIVAFSFVSEQPVGAVLVKAGDEEIPQIFDPPVTEGTVVTPNGKAISHVHFCMAEQTTSPPPSPTESPSPSPTESPSPSPTESPSPSPTESPSPGESPSPTGPEETTTPPPEGGVETGGGGPSGSLVPGLILVGLLALSLVLWRLRATRT